MVDFDIRRAELVECPTSDSRDWFLLNSKICGVPLARFMMTSPLVTSFPGEFTTVSIEELKNGTHLDRRVYKDETTLQTCADSTTNSLSDITVRLQRIQEENRELQTDLELAMSKLESLRDEVTCSSIRGGQSTEANEDMDDVWNSLIDVCDKYRVHLASVIADRALKPEVAKTLSDIADQLMEKRNRGRFWRSCSGAVPASFFNPSMCLIGPCCTSSCSPGFQTKAGRCY